MSAFDDDDDNPGYNKAAQYDPAWMEWAGPQRIAEQVDLLFDTTLPGIPKEPWWDTESDPDRQVKPMPACDRYHDDMLDWIAGIFDYFFASEEAVLAKSNRAIVDQFVAYIGECFHTRAGGLWMNYPGAGDPVYDTFGPCIGAFEFSDDIINPVVLLLDAADPELEDSAGFADIATDVYLAAADHSRHHGIPHPDDDLLRQHNLA